jgi:hypothetical protein
VYEFKIFQTRFVYVYIWLPWWHHSVAEKNITTLKTTIYFPRRFHVTIHRNSVDSTSFCPEGSLSLGLYLSCFGHGWIEDTQHIVSPQISLQYVWQHLLPLRISSDLSTVSLTAPTTTQNLLRSLYSKSDSTYYHSDLSTVSWQHLQPLSLSSDLSTVSLTAPTTSQISLQ